MALEMLVQTSLIFVTEAAVLTDDGALTLAKETYF